MRTLYHLFLWPACRKVRVVLGEKGLDATLRAENIWERRPDFLALNPAGEVPVLIDEDGTVVADAVAICEYLDEVYPDPGLIGAGPAERAEVRRLCGWFDLKFDREVTQNLFGEKMMKRFLRLGAPDSRAIRAGQSNIHDHLGYIGWLAERRNWLAGERFSLADISAASHLSVLDYGGDVPWDGHPAARLWYSRVKSRPSFRPILDDVIPGEPPPKHYADLDF